MATQAVPGGYDEGKLNAFVERVAGDMAPFNLVFESRR